MSDRYSWNELPPLGNQEEKRDRANFDVLLHELVQYQVEKTPDAVALRYEEKQITYQELDARANQLAHILLELGVGPDVGVGIACERSVELVIGLLGILKAGGAFIPLDPSYPAQRLRFMVEDAQLALLLTQEHLAPLFSEIPVRLLYLDNLPRRHQNGADKESSSQLPPISPHPQNLAYSIYTSGSTGQPKGVLNTHQGIVNRLLWMQQAYQLDPSDCVLQKTSMSFDVAVWEFFWPLLAGASIVLARPQGHYDPAYLAHLIEEQSITTLHFVPSMLHIFLQEPQIGRCTSLRRIFCSGEALTFELEQRCLSTFSARLYNLYGPTEAAIDVTHWQCQVSTRPRVVSIGQPISNIRIFLLDRWLQPVPLGEIGELCIAGVGLARGYSARPDLTAERFLPNPLSEDPGERLYRTGDLARYLPDGNLEFLGRLDNQVKIRGFRIELEEIQATLEQHPGVDRAVVQKWENTTGDNQLAVYVLPHALRAAPVLQLLALRQKGLLTGLTVHSLPDGLTVVCQNKSEVDFLYNEIFVDQSYLQAGITLEEHDCIFDVGANIGLFTLFAGLSRPNITVYAFEPIPAVCDVLRLNVRLYGLHAQVMNYGLASSPQQDVPFVYYPHVSLLSGRFPNQGEEQELVKEYLSYQHAAGQIDASSEAGIDELLEARLEAQTVTCQVKTLSQVIREHHIERIDLLKIDAEKSEQDVLLGIEEQDWARIRQIVIEVHDSNNRLDQVMALLEKHGYQCTSRKEASLSSTALYLIYATRTVSPQSQQVQSEKGFTWTNPALLIADIQGFLRARLPDYMIPNAVVLLHQLPLAPNGKIDRRALPDPAQALWQLDEPYVPPTTVTEHQIVSVWKAILGLPQLSVQSNFFHMGGHSLLAMQALSQLRSLFSLPLPIRCLFDYPTAAQLAQHIDETATHDQKKETDLELLPAPRDQALPLAFAQESVWFYQQLDPENISYQFQATLQLRGQLNLPALRESLNEIVRRHEIYRTTFPTLENRPVQEIHAPWIVPLLLIDISDIAPERREEYFQQHLKTLFRRRFDINTLPLIDWVLIKLEEQEHVLVHVEHHLIHDGWSFNLFLRELQLLYQAFLENEQPALPELKLQYADYAYWQHQWIEGEEAQRQLLYWQQRLENPPARLSLPTDYPRPVVQRFRGDALRVELPAGLCDELRLFCRREGITLYMATFAAFLTLLHCYTGQSDLCVGSGLANRRDSRIGNLIGMFVNTVALRVAIPESATFHDVLHQVRDVCLEAYENQEIPFHKVVELLHPERDPGYAPFYQVLFSFHDSPLADLDFPHLDVSLKEGLSNGSSKADLNIILIPHSEQQIGQAAAASNRAITVIWEYNTDLFTRATMLRMLDHFQMLLEHAIHQPQRYITDLPLMSSEEMWQFLQSRNALSQGAIDPPDILALLEDVVQQKPDAVAIVHGDTCITYAELDHRANQLAHYLLQSGLPAEAPVGVLLERSPDFVISLLGILKAGGAYLPLDSTYPEAHLAFMIEDAVVHVLLTQAHLLSLVRSITAPIICLDTQWDEIACMPHTSPTLPRSLEQLAYIIYTSGSTGTPKGTQIHHRGLINLVEWHLEAFAVQASDRATHLAGLSFDASVWELWPYLAAGVSIILVDDQTRLDPTHLLHFLDAQAITCSFLPTPLAEQMLHHQQWPVTLSLRLLLTGGDRLHHYAPPGLPFQLVNNYGTTENTVVATSMLVPAREETSELPAIGYPIANTQVYILNRTLQPVPVGVIGELYIGGVGLSRGYLKRPDVTAERFIPHPWSNLPGTRLYRTGDSARYRPDGSIEFLGRLDYQIKVRGFRVELEEIEAVLGRHPQVQQAIVSAFDDHGGDKQLVAYVQPAASALVPSADELRRFLRTALPYYMIPTYFIFREDFPLTQSGKINRHALQFSPEQLEEPGVPSEEPRSPIEQRLTGIWMQLLHTEHIRIHDNFFALGGHSLLIIQMLTRVQQVFQVALTPSIVFEKPTIAELAETILLQQASTTEALSVIEELLQLSDDEVRLLLAQAQDAAALEDNHGGFKTHRPTST